MTKTQSRIENISPGKTFGAATESFFYLVRKGEDGYEIDCGWAVLEKEDDDYLSHTYHPFSPRRLQPWVGRRFQAATATEAAAIYDSAKAEILARRAVKGGVVIGSVVRR